MSDIPKDILYSMPRPGIFTLSLLDPSACEWVVAQANAVGAWYEARVVSRADEVQVDLTYRSSAVLAFHPGSEIWQLFDEKIQRVIRPLIRATWGVDYPEHSSIEVLRYQPGDYFHTHRDNGPHGSGVQHRYFTVVCYLNDDFEGGETTFPDEGHTVAPKQGQAVIFPADYLHGGDKIRLGNKYVAVAWLQGRPPMRWI